MTPSNLSTANFFLQVYDTWHSLSRHIYDTWQRPSRLMWPSDFLLVAECQWPNLSPRLVTRGDIYELDLRHVAPCQRPNLAL